MPRNKSGHSRSYDRYRKKGHRPDVHWRAHYDPQTFTPTSKYSPDGSYHNNSGDDFSLSQTFLLLTTLFSLYQPEPEPTDFYRFSTPAQPKKARHHVQPSPRSDDDIAAEASKRQQAREQRRQAQALADYRQNARRLFNLLQRHSQKAWSKRDLKTVHRCLLEMLSYQNQLTTEQRQQLPERLEGNLGSHRKKPGKPRKPRSLDELREHLSQLAKTDFTAEEPTLSQVLTDFLNEDFGIGHSTRPTTAASIDDIEEYDTAEVVTTIPTRKAQKEGWADYFSKQWEQSSLPTKVAVGVAGGASLALTGYYLVPAATNGVMWLLSGVASAIDGITLLPGAAAAEVLPSMSTALANTSQVIAQGSLGLGGAATPFAMAYAARQQSQAGRTLTAPSSLLPIDAQWQCVSLDEYSADLARPSKHVARKGPTKARPHTRHPHHKKAHTPARHPSKATPPTKKAGKTKLAQPVCRVEVSDEKGCSLSEQIVEEARTYPDCHKAALATKQKAQLNVGHAFDTNSTPIHERPTPYRPACPPTAKEIAKPPVPVATTGTLTAEQPLPGSGLPDIPASDSSALTIAGTSHSEGFCPAPGVSMQAAVSSAWCPALPHTASPPSFNAAFECSLEQPGLCSFVVRGGGQTWRLDSRVILESSPQAQPLAEPLALTQPPVATGSPASMAVCRLSHTDAAGNQLSFVFHCDDLEHGLNVASHYFVHTAGPHTPQGQPSYAALPLPGEPTHATTPQWNADQIPVWLRRMAFTTPTGGAFQLRVDTPQPGALQLHPSVVVDVRDAVEPLTPVAPFEIEAHEAPLNTTSVRSHDATLPRREPLPEPRIAPQSRHRAQPDHRHGNTGRRAAPSSTTEGKQHRQPVVRPTVSSEGRQPQSPAECPVPDDRSPLTGKEPAKVCSPVRSRARTSSQPVARREVATPHTDSKDPQPQSLGTCPAEPGKLPTSRRTADKVTQPRKQPTSALSHHAKERHSDSKAPHSPQSGLGQCTPDESPTPRICRPRKKPALRGSLRGRSGRRGAPSTSTSGLFTPTTALSAGAAIGLGVKAKMDMENEAKAKAAAEKGKKKKKKATSPSAISQLYFELKKLKVGDEIPDWLVPLCEALPDWTAVRRNPSKAGYILVEPILGKTFNAHLSANNEAGQSDENSMAAQARFGHQASDRFGLQMKTQGNYQADYAKLLQATLCVLAMICRHNNIHDAKKLQQLRVVITGPEALVSQIKIAIDNLLKNSPALKDLKIIYQDTHHKTYDKERVAGWRHAAVHSGKELSKAEKQANERAAGFASAAKASQGHQWHKHLLQGLKAPEKTADSTEVDKKTPSAGLVGDEAPSTSSMPGAPPDMMKMLQGM